MHDGDRFAPVGMAPHGVRVSRSLVDLVRAEEAFVAALNAADPQRVAEARASADALIPRLLREVADVADDPERLRFTRPFLEEVSSSCARWIQSRGHSEPLTHGERVIVEPALAKLRTQLLLNAESWREYERDPVAWQRRHLRDAHGAPPSRPDDAPRPEVA